MFKTTSLSALIVVAAAAATFAFPTLAADDLPKLKVTSAAGSVTYDRDQLEKMGMVSIKTTTPWNEGVIDFEGVPLEKLLKEAGASGETATVTALNDYSVDIPTSDFSEFGTILAIKRNGEYMPVDDQGPFFVMYPFDSNPVLQGQPYHGRAVWQVKEISVE
ncbi:molybdopterin-dependent oxidoreductase [Devosia sp. D6-9]|nr:molybdopterin-dependent oxidoreductase [Devosia sp. D6-9]